MCTVLDLIRPMVPSWVLTRPSGVVPYLPPHTTCRLAVFCVYCSWGAWFWADFVLYYFLSAHWAGSGPGRYSVEAAVHCIGVLRAPCWAVRIFLMRTALHGVRSSLLRWTVSLVVCAIAISLHLHYVRRGYVWVFPTLIRRACVCCFECPLQGWPWCSVRTSVLARILAYRMQGIPRFRR
jgi:hypothetical protein